MAEVIAAFGTLSAVLQVVDFTAKLIAHAHELIRSGVDSVRENIETERLAREYDLLARIAADSIGGSSLTKEEKAIVQLSQACQAESRLLLELLDGLRVSASHHTAKRVAEGASKAVKIVRSQKKVHEHRKHLQELNGQLATALLLNLHAKKRVQEPLLSELQLSSDFRKVTAVVDAVVGNDVRKIKCLVEMEKAAHLLANLRFDQISRRWTAIVQAYPKTYHWVLEKESLGFTTWLRGENGIFWVNGKAGSGKSTLLKFLSEHQETRWMLSRWAGGSQLVFASFYFWYLGDQMQKTARGLCQSILYQILQDDDELMRLAFPSYFSSIIQFDVPITWSDEELRAALLTLATHKNTRQINKKFCLVIDGLDEYHGDSMDLLGLISQLVENPDIKICVSSRPWNAFVDAFESSVPNLRLEDLSSEDHRTYAHGRVQAACRVKGPKLKASPTDIDTLIDEIVKGAEGVFLWVFLVVKSVVSGIAEGETIDFLRHRVQSFPRDLNDFFRAILRQVDEVYQAQTNQALRLACMYTHENGPANERSSFVDYWLIKQHPRGIETDTTVYDLPIQDLTSDQLEEMFLGTRSFLSACCKGLLYIPVSCTGGVLDISIDAKVEFLHRTVYDYLMQGDIQESIDKELPGVFKTPRIFHLLNLARLKCTLPKSGELETRYGMINAAAAYPSASDKSYVHETEVDQFDTIVYSQPILSNPWWFRYPRLFMFFQKYKYLKACLAFPHGLNFSAISGRFHTRVELIEALLGESTDWPFGAEKINRELLEKLLEDPGIVKNMLSRITWGADCPGSLWQLLLRKWALSNVDYAKSACVESRKSAPRATCDLWRLAQLFVELAVVPNEEFCSGVTGGNGSLHVCQKQLSSEFLKSRLPPELHSEVDTAVDA